MNWERREGTGSVHFEVCESTSQWSRYTAFYVEHRQNIIPGYQVKDALMDIKNCMRNGRAGILTDGAERIIGIGSFVLGLEAEGFSNKEIAVLGNSYFVEEFRSNRTFIRGLQALAEHIKEMNEAVKEVRIPTTEGNLYTNKLYRKIAEQIGGMDTRYGPFRVYSTSYESFVRFCNRFV